MVFIGAFLGGRKSWNAGGGGSLDDGVEVKSRGCFATGGIAEVGEVEGGLTRLALDAGDKFAYFDVRLDGIDVHNIIGAGVAVVETRGEVPLNVQAVAVEFYAIHAGDGASGEQKAWVVNADDTVLVNEALLVDVDELVVLDASVAVCLAGKATLDGGA